MGKVVYLKDYRKLIKKPAEYVLTPELEASIKKINRLMTELKELATKEKL